jgi:predicted dehydrogenase
MKFKVGVIGCGVICENHIIPLIENDNTELVAVCDIVEDKAIKYANKYNCKAYFDYKEMLESEELDSVHICLPHYLHSEVAIYAMEHGVNVLTEKPMDIDLESAERAVAVAKEKNKLFGVIFQCRYNNPAQLVKNAIKSGKLGKIISARSVYCFKIVYSSSLGSVFFKSFRRAATDLLSTLSLSFR